MQPRRPSHLSPIAAHTLQAIAEAGLGRVVSLGGALGLLHYLDYRPTHDVDAWWSPDASGPQRREVLDVVAAALAAEGKVSRRAWGDVVSLDLRQEGKVVFNFQVASRSARLLEPQPAPWVDVLIDSLPDLLASKMVALVERGAPRDFRDVHAVCQAGLTTAAECWSLWRRRQKLAGSDTDSHRARMAVELHLERIARHRPLESILDVGQRAQARAVREWFKGELLNALRD